MSNYYSGGYGGPGNQQNQQQTNDGFYNNTSNAAAPPQQPSQSFATTGTAQSWAAPSQQQQRQETPAFWNPAAAASVIAATTGGNSNAMLDLASSAGKSFFQSSSARMIPGLELLMQTLRTYFAVDNAYVKTKMLKILIPFRSKHWKRQQSDPSTSYNSNDLTAMDFCLPLVDENAPDLYLPIMSLITYVLLCALCYGNAGQFSPEVLPDVTSKCIFTQLLEVLCIRFGFYMMQASVKMLDLWSFTGYKYLGLCCNMLVGVCLSALHLGHRGYYLTFTYTACACSYFMLKTMANNIPLVTAATGPKREVMVVAFAASQFATMWFVSQTKFL
jgi:hypothetical protein